MLLHPTVRDVTHPLPCPTPSSWGTRSPSPGDPSSAPAGCTARSAQSFSWKWLWNARLTRLRLNTPKTLERWIAVCTFFSLLLSIIIRKRNTVIYAARSPYPDWTVMQINSDQTALVALDEFHANKKGKTMKSDINLVSPICNGAHTRRRIRRSDWTAELSSLLIFSLSRSHLLRKGNYIQTNPIANLTTAESKLTPPLSQFMCHARLCCYWINARSFHKPSDSPVN